MHTPARPKMGRPRGPNFRIRNSGRGQVRGSRSPHSVLTEELARKIKWLAKTYNFTTGNIREYLAEDGLHFKYRTIYDVLVGNTWRHVHLDGEIP